MIHFHRDAEIIYGKVASQKRVKKRRRTGDSAASSYQSEAKELNRSKVWDTH